MSQGAPPSHDNIDDVLDLLLADFGTDAVSSVPTTSTLSDPDADTKASRR